MNRRSALILSASVFLVATGVRGSAQAEEGQPRIGRIRLATPEWIEVERRNIQALVDEHALPDTRFSFCEVFTDAPPEIVGYKEGRGGYCYRILGKKVTIAPGEIDDADIKLTMPYKPALYDSITVGTPELRERRAKGLEHSYVEGLIRTEGDMAKMPKWLQPALHNLVAAQTA